MTSASERPEPNRCRRLLQAAAMGIALLSVTPARAGDQPQTQLEQAQWLVARGQHEQARELLRRLAELQPKVELFALAQAASYLAESNPFWALKILGEFIAREPPACAARALAARIHIQEANLDQAERSLDEPRCLQAAEMRLRFVLLKIELSELRGTHEQTRQLALEGRSLTTRFVEDDRRLTRLLDRYDPRHEPYFLWQLDFGAGWASRGISSVPIDIATPAGVRNLALLGMDMMVRLVPVNRATWRTVVEGEFHSLQYLESPAKSLNSRQPLLRLGPEFGSGTTRLFLGYAADWANLDADEGNPGEAHNYAQGHRLVYRLNLAHGFQAHGELGRRWFWVSERTRSELEQGLSKWFALSEQVKWTLGTDWRIYKANARVYDQAGATLYTRLDVGLPNDFRLSESLAVARDRFVRSEGYFDPASAVERRDTVVRIGLTLTSPEVFGIRLAATYGYANRDSTASAYSYADHRALLSATWQSDSDRFGVSRIGETGRIPLRYPDDEAPKAGQPKREVIEVLRQDETERRGTSCLK